MGNYNLTLIANSSGPVQFLQRINSELMMNMYGVLILITLSIIIFIGFVSATNNTNKSLGATSFIAFALSILLRALGLVPDFAWIFCLVLAAGGAVLIKK